MWSRTKARANIDWTLLYVTLALAVFGVVMVYSTSSLMAEQRFGSHLFFFKRQTIWLLISLVVMAAIIKIDLKRLAPYAPLALLTVILLLSLVFTMPARNGSQRWLFLGPFALQPSEMAKIVLVYYLAFSLANTKRDLQEWRNLALPYAPLIGLTLALVMLEPDLGTAITIGLTVLALFFMAGVRVTHLLLGLAPLGAAACLVVFVFGYKIARVKNFIASLADPLQGGYQVKQAILTLGSGGLTGAGLGDGRQKHFFLPYPHTDFVFAAIGEEVGFIGVAVVLLLFFTLLYRGLRIAAAQPDRFGYLLASGVTLCLFFNIAINIAVVTSLAPTTGLPLPLLSYGGSSLLVTLASVGILLNLSRRRDGWTG